MAVPSWQSVVFWSIGSFKSQWALDTIRICPGERLYILWWILYSSSDQYYLPSLEQANKTHPPQFELEYLTYSLDSLHPNPEGGSEEPFVYPVPVKLLPKSLRIGGVNKSDYAPYKMKDLTIPSWIKLGRRLGDEKHKKLRKKFRQYMFAGGEEE